MQIYTKLTSSYFPLFFLLIITITGCTSEQTSNVESGTQNQILHIGNGTEPQGLDPHFVTGVSEHNIITSLIEGLVSKHPENLTPVSGMADSWQVSEDGKTYIFHIRNDAKWSNGDSVTANDFVYSWKRALTPTLGNQYAYMLYPVQNAEAFNNGTLKEFDEVGIRAIDSQTLEVNLNQSTPYFLGILDHYSTFPVHKNTIEKYGEIDTRGSEWTRAGNFVGNGPFILKEWEQNRIIIVEKNPNYWDADNVKLSEIHFHPIDQQNTEERLFRTGQLHITYSTPPEKIETYLNDSPELIKIHPYLGTYFYRINTTAQPLNDKNIRLALAMTIDRSAIVEKITKGGQNPAYTLTPPETLGYTSKSAIAYDTDKARQLFADAGYPNGENFPEIQILFNTLDTHRLIAEAIQQMWKKELNINVTLYNQEWKVYLDTESSMNYQISRAAWIGDYVDPNTFLNMFVSNSGINRTGWSNTEYDKLIGLAATEPNQKNRYQYFQEAEKILNEEVPIIPIYTYSKVFLKSPAVKGWYPNLLDHHPYKYVYLQTDASAY